MSYPLFYKTPTTNNYAPIPYVFNPTTNTVEPAPTEGVSQLLKIVSVTATSDDGNVPSNVIDGNPNTRWSAEGKGQKLNLDLGTIAPQDIHKLEITWYGQRQCNADILVDNVKITSITSATSTPTSNVEFPPNTRGKVVTIVGNGNNINAWNSIIEVKLYGKQTSEPVPPTPTPTPTPPPTGGRDKYGIKMLFPSVGGREFFPPVPAPSGTVNATGRIGSTLMVAHGQGSVTPGTDYYKLAGSAPRMYMYDTSKTLWKANLELTCYYNLVSKSSTSYAGFVMGGPSRHEAGGSMAKAYYLKHHYTSKKFYLMKEQEHGGSGNAGYTDNASSSPTSPVDLNKWYGAKLIVRTSADGKSVKLEAYKDDTGGANGGDWKKMTEKVDNGSWNSYPPFFDGTSCMFRTDGVTDFRYKWFSVRTIAGL